MKKSFGKISHNNPTIGILKIPYNPIYTLQCRQKIESIFRNGISPEVYEIDYTKIAIPPSDCTLPLDELRKKYSNEINKYASECFSQVDGLMLPGNRFDIHPESYGEKLHPKTNPYLYKKRELFVEALLHIALERNITPLFTICGSMQQFYVVMGGKLVQHVPELTGTEIHRQYDRAYEPVHGVRTTGKSHYYSIVQSKAQRDHDPEGKEPIENYTNSIHHQAADPATLPPHMMIVAKAHDGVVEAIEHKYLPAMGTQYHPELRKRQDKDGKFSLKNGEYLHNLYGDGKDYDQVGNELPADEDYYSGNRLLENLVDQSIAHRKKREMHDELLDLVNTADKTPEIPWTQRILTERTRAARLLPGKSGSQEIFTD